MTNRKDWELGASIGILGGLDALNCEGFSQYAQANIKHCELLLWPSWMEKLDFLEHPEKLNQLINDCDVNVYSVHIPFTPNISLSSPDEKITEYAIESMKAIIRAAVKIGAKLVVIHPSTGHYDEWQKRDDLLRHSIKCVGEVSRYANSLGIMASVENLGNGGLGERPEEMLEYLTKIDGLGMCFDLNHSLIVSNEEFFDTLITAGMHGRINHIHVSDYDFTDEKHWLPGKGINDWDMIFSKLEELDYNGVFMYEVDGKTTSCKEIEQNYKNLIKL